MEIGMICDGCKNINELLIDGWLPSCKAFPEGIPAWYAKVSSREKDTYKVCNNGIGYEPEITE